jgi:hypothetical protein
LEIGSLCHGNGAQMELAILSQVHPEVDVPLLVSALLDYGRDLRMAGSRPDLNSLPAKGEGDGHRAEAETSSDGGK